MSGVRSVGVGGGAGVGRLLAATLAGALVGAVGTWILTRGELGRAEAARVQAEWAVQDMRAREAILTARIALDDAVEHLDARNYGLMAADVDQAAFALSKLDQRDLDEVRAELDILRQDVATRPADQRDALRALERRLTEGWPSEERSTR